MVGEIVYALETSRLSPRQLTLEITESVLVTDIETMAHAIVKLSHTLQLHTVAEGIEHAEQAAHLATLGCQDGQGYPFARPLAAAAMTELLAESLADGGFYLPVAQNLEAAVGT